MDLGAYVNINVDEYQEVIRKNNIVVPRLRGYRLMKYEKPVSKEDLSDMLSSCELRTAEDMIRSIPIFHNDNYCHEYSRYKDYLIDYYLPLHEDGKRYIDWSRIHGWERRNLKFEIKKNKKRIEKQFAVWDKYAGRSDILYIHARIGGGNWSYYYKDVINQPWFLEKVDDSYDSTYCDIYAKIEG